MKTKALAVVLGATGLALAGEPVHPVFPRIYPGTLSLSARSAVITPFLNQSRNGQALEHTLWNDYFLKEDGQLHPAGRLVLDRLARRQLDQHGHGPLLVMVRRAYDLPSRKTRESAPEVADTLDRKRADAVRTYLAANWPAVSVVVLTNDPTPVGLSSKEAIIGAEATRNISQGFIPDTLIQGGIEGAISGTVTRGTTLAPTLDPGRASTSTLGTGGDAGGGGGAGGPGASPSGGTGD